MLQVDRRVQHIAVCPLQLNSFTVKIQNSPFLAHHIAYMDDPPLGFRFAACTRHCPALTIRFMHHCSV